MSNFSYSVDATDATFVTEVIEASKSVAVLVDFWAPWCGPCKQLTPLLEKVVAEAKGRVKLVKIDIDKNQGFASQLRIQSVPTVYAFIDGKPVDGFMGAKSESELKAFIEKLGVSSNDGAPSIEEAIDLGKQSFGAGDITSALEAYAYVLEADPKNLKAIAGIAQIYLSVGQTEQAIATLALAPEDTKDAEILGLRAAIELSSDAPSNISDLEARLLGDALDHQTRFDLARGYAGVGKMDLAVDHILIILNHEPMWHDDAARQYLFKIFSALGHSSDITKSGRRRLASLIFS